MKTAWIITWTGTNLQIEKSERIVAIFDPRKSPSKVKEFMEEFYKAHTNSTIEKFLYARSKKANPYPAKFGEIRGIMWTGRIYCGHNPHLYGRRVQNLRVVTLQNEERLEWDEIPPPKPIIFEQ